VERYIRLGLAELFLARGQHADAEEEATRATATGTSAKPLRADAHALLGRIKAAAGDLAAADREFEAALATLDPGESAELLVEIHHAYAQALKDRGDTAGALEQMEAAMALTHPGLATQAQRAAGRASASSA